MRLVKNLCRIIVGIVFIYSGFVKGIDPLGSDYKFTDYFNAFGMGWMNATTLFFSFALSLTEFLIGIALLFNLWVSRMAWGSLLFMAFFTPLTLVLALTNPVSDCGCFGDAMILTNWQTFWKNIILLLLAIMIFVYRKEYKSSLPLVGQFSFLALAGAGMLCLSVYCYRHLPVLDFRPYAVGKNITEGMRLPEGTEPDQYEVTLKYKNKQTGEVLSFTEENYPWQDTLNWEYESSSERLVKKGYITPIHDLIIEHPTLGNITEEILEDDNHTILAVAYNLTQSDVQYQPAINRLAEYAQEKGIRFYGLTSSSERDIETYKKRYHVPYEFCTADEIQLKTMIRSNPGVIILREGTILDKWAGKDVPDVKELQDTDLTAYCMYSREQMQRIYLVYSIILLFFVAYLLIPRRKGKRNN
ncbi:MAG: DoxX family protein [Butyricimonas virosa]|uniref:BT_3928 family protein n=1 Tax=Butyricimonas virosa TaxID=544645 RepID=UPI002432F595|nr:BT_3928 family protein [Butyricimonas virosa]MDY5533284.1 DoxX family protein [Butyricimonas virosa]